MGVLRRPGRRGKNQALARNGGKAIKIFIISDLHGSAAAFERAAAAFEREKADLMLVCGDYLNHGPRNDIPEGYDTKALAARLNAFKARLCAVRGNCDSEVDQMVLDFPVLSATAQIFLPPFCDCNCGEGLADGEKPTDKGANSGSFADKSCVRAAGENTAETTGEAYAGKTCGSKSSTNGGSASTAGFRPCGRIFAHHGHSISEERAATLTVAGTIIVSGHTHVPVLEQRGGRVFVNPGSISIPKGGSAAGYAVIDAPASGASLSIALKTLSGELVKELKWAWA